MPRKKLSGKRSKNQTPVETGHLNGVFTALVTDVGDPEEQGRIKVLLTGVTDSDGESLELWARLATSPGRHNRGSWSLPEIQDEVLVAFAGRDHQSPIIIGSLWNGAGSPDRYELQTRNGMKITLDETEGQAHLILETRDGRKLLLKDSPALVEIDDSNGNSIKLEAGGITLSALAKVTIRASMIEVSSGLTQFSGVVQCDTLISNAVVSAVYTPGVGNLR